MKLVHSTADKYTETHIRNTVPVIAPTCGWEWGLHGISAQVLQISVLETKDALSSEESCSNPKWFKKQISHGSVCSVVELGRVFPCATSAYVCINYVYVSAAGSKCFLMFPHFKKNILHAFCSGELRWLFWNLPIPLQLHAHMPFTHTLTESRGSSLQDCILTQRQVLDGKRRAWWRQKASPVEMGT